MNIKILHFFSVHLLDILFESNFIEEGEVAHILLFREDSFNIGLSSFMELLIYTVLEAMIPFTSPETLILNIKTIFFHILCQTQLM